MLKLFKGAALSGNLPPAVIQLLDDRNAEIEQHKSSWNNGEINLPVFHTNAVYHRGEWQFEITNENRDSVYHENDFSQEYVSNQWHIRATPTNSRSYPDLRVVKSSWFKRKALLGSNVNCRCDVKRLKDDIEYHTALKEVFKSPYAKFTVKGGHKNDQYQLWTAFVINKFTVQKVQLAVAVIETIVGELDKGYKPR